MKLLLYLKAKHKGEKMIEKFNGIFYLAVFIIHFIGFAYYGFRCVFQTKSFLDQYGIDDTGAGMVRFFGSIFFGSVVMAIYVGFIRPNGCLLYTSPSPRDNTLSRMPSSA